MTGFLGNAYLWIKAAHIIFVIFWMAGLFMLPRFLVYHQEDRDNPDMAARWAERERRLSRFILNPAIAAVWILGLILALDTGAFGMTWFWIKLVFVIALSGYQGWMQGYARKLTTGADSLSGKQLRLINEVPGIAAILIIILVIVRPF